MERGSANALTKAPMDVVFKWQREIRDIGAEREMCLPGPPGRFHATLGSDSVRTAAEGGSHRCRIASRALGNPRIEQDRQ